MEARDPAAVAVISGRRLYADALASLLANTGRFQVTARAASTLEAIPVLGSTASDAVLLTSPVAGDLDAIELLKTRFPGLPLVVLDVPDDIAWRWVHRGVAAVLPDYSSPDDLHRALEVALGGGRYLSGRATAFMFERVRSDQGLKDAPSLNLTPRESEITALLGRGYSNEEIGAQLHIEESTVKSHVHHILEKFGVRSRFEIPLRLQGPSIDG